MSHYTFRCSRLFVLATLVACAVGASSVTAAEPSVRNVSLRGLRIGGTTTLTVDGDDLGTAPRLLLPFAAEVSLSKGATNTKATFEVKLAGDVTPGLYHLRVVTDGGVSLPVLMAVDRLDQAVVDTKPDAKPQALPIAVTGSVAGATVAEVRFAGRKGQEVVLELEAQRLGSKLRPTLHLYDEKRVQLGWSWSSVPLFGDTRLVVTLPADGTYIAAVHDAEYAAPNPSYFRLKAGDFSYVDQVFPSVIGSTAAGGGDPKQVELLGRGKGTTASLPSPSRDTFLPLTLPADVTWTGPRPFVRRSQYAELLEQPAAAGEGQPLPEGAVAVSGRLATPGETDRYTLSVKPGSKLRFEVFAERTGSPIDVALALKAPKGAAALVRGEDGPNTLDPVLDYTVPAGTETLIAEVIDAQRRGGPRGLYRLVIEVASTTGRVDYALETVAQRVSLPVGGTVVLPVLVERTGYDGAIELDVEGLPKSVQVSGASIPARAEGTLLTFTRTGDLTTAALLALKGKGEAGLERPVLIKGHPLSTLQPWLAGELAMAGMVASASDFEIAWRAPSSAKPDASTAAGDTGNRIVLGAKLPLPIQIKRADDKLPVRLTLVTSQIPPVNANNQPDATRALRVERAVELGAKQNDGELSVLIPNDLPSASYDVTVQAELLTANKASVLATAYTPVRRLDVAPLFELQVASEPALTAEIDGKGATVKVKGRVVRNGPVPGDITLAVTGLPTGARSDATAIKTGTDTFEFQLIFPANTPRGELKEIKLTASTVPNPAQANLRTKSPDVNLAVVLTKPETKNE